MDKRRALLRRTAEIAADFLESLDERPVFPETTPEELRRLLGGPLPDVPTDPRTVIEQLRAAAEPGVVAIPSGRYFGFVIGGSGPPPLAAGWLASGWGHKAGVYVPRPSAPGVGENTRGRVRGPPPT